MRKGSGTYQEMFEHACDLERELAQARAECERLKDALEPIRIAGDASGPEFRKMFEDAAKRPEYWTEMCEMLRAECAAAEAMNGRLRGLLLCGSRLVIEFGSSIEQEPLAERFAEDVAAALALPAVDARGKEAKP